MRTVYPGAIRHVDHAQHIISIGTQIAFKLGTAATSPLVFGASVWKGGVKLADATPVTVR